MAPKKQFDILILEDEQEIAQIMKTYLKLFPPFHRIVYAENGLQAAQKVSNQSFDLIITDIQLNKQSALSFIERLRKQPRFYNQKIMVVSGCLTQEITLKLMRLGIRYILVKPFTARQLLINAISCLGIEKKPENLVDNIIVKVKGRFSDEKDRFENAVPDDKLSDMIKNSKGEK
ncbi:MAG: hypothetical protein CME62_00650 [Halobacteriovoraceae bacterium]|nr:hypothetical protein [Halobacteriovoraceae bacterium]